MRNPAFAEYPQKNKIVDRILLVLLLRLRLGYATTVRCSCVEPAGAIKQGGIFMEKVCLIGIYW